VIIIEILMNNTVTELQKYQSHVTVNIEIVFRITQGTIQKS